MCTAVTYKTKDHYFGRTLDYDVSYQERVAVTPRNFPFQFRQAGKMEKHYAMIGMASMAGDYPLYYDATNEMGLSMAGLNFPGNADYKPVVPGKDNVAPFEFIPWILGQCKNIREARTLLERMNLAEIRFDEHLSLATLHWIISDREASITVESVKEGLKVYENPVGVLTNNPPFDYQMFYLNNFLSLSKEMPENNFSEDLELKAYSRGMGAMGMPGDLSSASRFVRAAFTKLNSVSGDSESESISQFFHILGSVEHPRGCVHLGDGKYEITMYTSCCNTDRGIYYYTTYENSQITGVDMHREDLDGSRMVSYPLIQGQQIWIQNINETNGMHCSDTTRSSL
ncbi:MAG: choloylglycine hydrolase [Lachnospiraceae bacterium]|nr:choloylglycine hydrolase [Lachnospiraceae bacterium]